MWHWFANAWGQAGSAEPPTGGAQNPPPVLQRGLHLRTGAAFAQILVAPTAVIFATANALRFELTARKQFAEPVAVLRIAVAQPSGTNVLQLVMTTAQTSALSALVTDADGAEQWRYDIAAVSASDDRYVVVEGVMSVVLAAGRA